MSIQKYRFRTIVPSLREIKRSYFKKGRLSMLDLIVHDAYFRVLCNKRELLFMFVCLLVYLVPLPTS